VLEGRGEGGADAWRSRCVVGGRIGHRGFVPSLTSLVGGATAAYSAAVVVGPRLLLKPCGLEQSPDTGTLTRAIGARDAALGLAMIAAPAGPARWGATASRIAADWSDAAVFGAALAGRGTRGKVVGFAAAWGALSLAAGLLDARRRP